ncbi:hypothetical protein EIA06_28275, partial [Escherichia coli]
MVNERRDYEVNFLYYPEVFAAALSRVEPDTSVLGWLGQARALACWCELLRLDPLETCVEWSARGVNAGKGDRAILASALRDLDDLDRLAAAGAFLRCSGVSGHVAAGR